MFKTRGFFLAFLLVGVGVQAASPRSQHLLKDGGRTRTFEMDQDETGVRSPGEEPEIVLYEKGVKRNAYTRRILTKKIHLVLEPNTDTSSVVKFAGASGIQPVAHAPGNYILTVPTSMDALDSLETLQTFPGVISATPLLARLQMKKFVPSDPLFTNQWHLLNSGQGGGLAGVDINVTNVWETYRGTNVTIGIVDDGLQTTHPDLSPNVNTTIDYDWNDATPNDPNPDTSVDYHGTACAGVAAARGNNAIGVSGAAPDATLVGMRLIADVVTDADEAEAMTHSNAIIFIKSNSWGPSDDGETLGSPGTLTQSAFETGVTSGRDGKGTIYVWAGGNGLENNDNVNYDAYANSIYTIAVGAIADDGTQAYYSEPGACLVISSPSGGGSSDITTTDLVGHDGYNDTEFPDAITNLDYNSIFSGTSSATPLVAGVIALMLEANTNLGWRDVQEILIASATKNDESDSDWVTNAAGFHFNHKYGPGLINADSAVTLAATWTNLAAQTTYETAQTNLSLAIPDNDTDGVTRSFSVTNQNMRVEHVAVTLDATHAARGNLIVTLTSPSGTESILAEVHADTGNDYSDWTFMSVRHWGESMQGTWTLLVADQGAGNTGTLNSAILNFYGTSIATLSNQPPVLATIGDQSGIVSNTVQFTVSASDVDGDVITLSVSNAPAGSTFSATNEQGTFLWTNASPLGVYTTTFYAVGDDGMDSETILITVSPPPPCGLIISEYVEGSSNNKAIELFNGTSSEISLSSSNYVLQLYANGSPTPGSPISLTGQIASAGTYVITHSSASTTLQAYAQQKTTTLNFNGNDAVVLRVGGSSGTVVDAIGQVGDDPGSGSGWGSGTNLTIDQTLRRLSSVTSGDTNSTDTFTPSTQWDFHAVDTFSGLGSHMMDCSTLPMDTPPLLSSIGNTSVQVSNLLQFTVTATPTESDTVTLSASNLPAGAVFNSTNENGTFSFTPDASQIGVATTTFYAVDDDGTDSETITITITAGEVSGSTNILVYFDFNTTAGVFEASAETSSPGIAVSTMTTRDGTSTNYGGNPGRAIGDNGWTGAIHYFEFTVTVSNNYQLNADGFLFDDQRSAATGPTGWRLRYSEDGYTVDLGSASTHSSFTTNSMALFLNGMTGAVTFRVYGESATSGGGTWRLDNVKLSGSLSSSNDADSDNIDDAWELSFFPSLTNVSATSDYDSDGFNDLYEYLAGTIPTNDASLLETVATSNTTSGVVVQWLSVTNKNYIVQRTTNLLEGFNGVASNLAATPPLNTYTDNVSTSAVIQLYRIQLQ